MALRKYVPSSCDTSSSRMKPLSFSGKVHANLEPLELETQQRLQLDVSVDHKEVYFLIMHFLSSGPCKGTYLHLGNELLEHNLLPRRYHAWYSRSGDHSGHEKDDGTSFPLNYDMLVARYSHIETDHLAKLLKQLLLNSVSSLQGVNVGRGPTAADVPTLLGTGSFSLLNEKQKVKRLPPMMRWPHKQADQLRGLSLREIGGGFTRHHQAPSIRAACYAIAKPSTMVQKMQNIKRIRGHRNAVYCAIFDRSGRYVITGSDDRLVKIWSMETAYCLASCRGHEGDITDLAISSNNILVASSSNDCMIRVWRLPDGQPVSVLRGHAGAVTAIAFSPRPSSIYQLLSSSDDGTCRLWDVRYSQFSPRIYVPKPSDAVPGRNGTSGSAAAVQSHQIFCCAFNASGNVFVTGSSDNLARVWNACKPSKDESEPNNEMDVLSGHENDVNYVQFSGCATASRFLVTDNSKDEGPSKFKNSWFSHDNIVTCSRDGSAIIWIPKSRRSHGKVGRWTRAYHLKVPPPPMPPQPPRGGPRQRILPTPRGVNMIVWSLDNRFVLAAIMDCRICVWNAADGSLVHSLTGHSDSTYVLDVHPFNPRIAMSAGYDGKTIVWDIWEGKPIRIYEISRFKLVDGKFSPDGTSIILSDDVGQLYILSTGQGESQKDAKYDQFFLGDYRPLIQDTYGNVLDQETQLAPYRRNMQDLLCDSAMTPYEEPYQSMYQRRRLGALGVEWHPPSVRLAVGPDLSVGQDFPMLPLADLDVLAEPLPDFLDAMEWEPENEIYSDDNDSEYSIPDEYSSGRGQESLDFNSSDDDLESISEDTGAENSDKDSLRRSKRRQQKGGVEITTSSGRRVKRRNLDDEGNGDAGGSSRPRKNRSGRKNRSARSEGFRPQRAAARNALNLFSRITGVSNLRDDNDDGSESDVSVSESTGSDSKNESEHSDRLSQDERKKHLKGKHILIDESTGHSTQDSVNSLVETRNKRRLIFKLPARDANKSVSVEKTDDKLVPEGVIEVNGGMPHEQTDADRSRRDLLTSFGVINFSVSEDKGKRPLCDVQNLVNLSVVDNSENLKWGSVRARTSKRQRMDGHPSCPPENNSTDRAPTNGHSKDGSSSPKDGGSGSCEGIRENHEDAVTKTIDDGLGHGHLDDDGCIALDEKSACLAPSGSGTVQLQEVKEHCEPVHVDVVGKDDNEAEARELELLDGDGMHFHENGSSVRFDSNDGDDAFGQLGSQLEASGSTMPAPHPCSRKDYGAVYRRLRLNRNKGNLHGDNNGVGESTSNPDNQSFGVRVDMDGSPDGSHNPHSTRLKLRIQRDVISSGNNNLNGRPWDESDDQIMGLDRDIENGRGSPPDEMRSDSRVRVGLRSARVRRASCHLQETSPAEKRKSNPSSNRKRSWLLLTSQEEGSRYIPQHGDEVVYLRQGHEEFMQYNGAKEHGPWSLIKGDIKASEYCRVESLEYAIYPGSGESCCKMILRFVDPSSSVFQKSFKLTLPEVNNFPDFLVEKSRFEAAMQRDWRTRDHCSVWWRDESDENGGSWWTGRVLCVKPKSTDFPDSPWERYGIKYRDDTREVHQHSPWELFDPESERALQLQQLQPSLDEKSRDKLLTSINRLQRSGSSSQDRYGVQKLMQVSQKSSFINRFPVPLSLEVIQLRLENGYYRTLEAVKHDISVMLSNAEAQFGRSPEISTKIRRLQEYFERTLSSLQS
ncbi:hypothetical protein MLD38_019620 [Melastoma candidum]|uniref:Uncharacterized protein n=1 Tax=Melastoma candidum TaxID=119954 RepID=A0ACB9QYN6_9MYRT|nr:hypothetical protein MLD38_019620 [Melastoma candidum]